MFYSPATLSPILRHVDIKLQAFIQVEGQCSLAHTLFGLTLALVLGLALIYPLQLCKVIIDVFLNKSIAAASSFDESLYMWFVTLSSQISFESQLGLPLRFGGWHLVEIWLRLGFKLSGHGRLIVDL